ncbi:MAG TPA: DivIVA domain-containing protein [Bacillota bacterium]|jgi:cell division initiation protein|nr:septum formation initiator [Clostridiales bacterium UBA9856]HOA43041.1 DivIVA domain-containing protein [Bacillota bacterium]HPZ59237.1 DivIVA domain-containing protein [Bacillota bacterium]HQC81964.1 DivIVA domain-containing protein [Bacillota bacterium]
MITPLDIQNQEFTRGVRGYKPEEVDTFLDLITTDMERLIEENNNLKEQVRALSAELERYRSTEGMVLDTLEAAKALMGDISASAEKRAEILLKNAELDADRITREAREYAERLHKENENLRNRFNAFRTKYKALLESELERFDTLSKELFDDKGMEDLKSILESKTENLSYERKDDREEGVDFTDKTIFNFRAGSEK